MNRRTARAIQQGRGSLLVTLPKDWTRGTGVEKGDLLDLVYDGESVQVKPVRKIASAVEGRNPDGPVRRPAQPAGTDERGLADAGS